MPRQETTIRTLYSFAELSDTAKEAARDWYRGCIESDELSDHDDWSTIADIFGIQLATKPVRPMGGGTRHEPVFYWELNPDSAAFEGRYSYAKAAPRRIREHAPQDAVLHGIADRLQDAQRRGFYRFTAECTTGGRSGTSQRVQVYRLTNYDYPEYVDNTAIEEALSDFAHWIAGQVSAQEQYLNSAEAVDESIECNAYEFTDSGDIA